MLNTKTSEKAKPDEVLISADIQSAVKAELKEMLSAPIFSHSDRCKRFLTHIVQQTLSGNTDQLKERMIGISVFDRANDYNTGEDAIVRVTANEVRKRIGQFYQDSPLAHPIQIDLPRGSYVPEFRIHLAGQGGASQEAAAATDSKSRESAGWRDSSAAKIPLAHAASLHETPGSQPASVSLDAPQSHRPHRLWLSLALLLLLLGTSAFLAQLWRTHARNRTPDVWRAFLEAKAPVLVCLGTHDIPDANAASTGETEDVVMRKDTIPIDDATVVSSMARLLGNKGVPFRLVAADRTTLTDLQMQPVILIGAVDNKWTLQLTQTLRYRVSVAFPRGPDKPPVASIVDSEKPATSEWQIDFSVPLSAWKADYAIVAKHDDATIGVPVLIEAGLGNAGSLAASEFVTSEAMTSALEHESSCKGKSSFEAVIGTEIIDTRPGTPHLLRLACW